jgi:ABC-type multidrug transport system permease subunit
MDYNKEEQGEQQDDNSNHNAERQNVISLMDSFIEQLSQTKKTLILALSLSISSIVLAPLAIGLSIFLFLHPSFFATLEREEEFGLFLIIMLSSIIIVSLIWLVAGFKQYRSIRSWNKKYNIFLKKKKDIDRDIATEYDLDKD